jgi:hypothetical protein
VAGAPGGRGDDTIAIATVNPATGEIVKTYDEMSEDDVKRCLAAAAAAHASYRLTSFDARAWWDAPGRQHPRRGAGPDRGDDDHPDGQERWRRPGRKWPSAPRPAGITPGTPPGSWPTIIENLLTEEEDHPDGLNDLFIS